MERSQVGLFLRIMIRATLLSGILLGFAHWAITADTPKLPKPGEKQNLWESAASKARMPKRKARKFLEILGKKVERELREKGVVVVPGVGTIRRHKTPAHMKWVSPNKTEYQPAADLIVIEPPQPTKENPTSAPTSPPPSSPQANPTNGTSRDHRTNATIHSPTKIF